MKIFGGLPVRQNKTVTFIGWQRMDELLPVKGEYMIIRNNHYAFAMEELRDILFRVC